MNKCKKALLIICVFVLLVGCSKSINTGESMEFNIEPGYNFTVDYEQNENNDFIVNVSNFEGGDYKILVFYEDGEIIISDELSEDTEYLVESKGSNKFEICILNVMGTDITGTLSIN